MQGGRIAKGPIDGDDDKLSPWFWALRQFNLGKEIYCVPVFGTKDYATVHKLMTDEFTNIAQPDQRRVAAQKRKVKRRMRAEKEKLQRLRATKADAIRAQKNRAIEKALLKRDYGEPNDSNSNWGLENSEEEGTNEKGLHNIDDSTHLADDYGNNDDGDDTESDYGGWMDNKRDNDNEEQSKTKTIDLEQETYDREKPNERDDDWDEFIMSGLADPYARELPLDKEREDEELNRMHQETRRSKRLAALKDKVN